MAKTEQSYANHRRLHPLFHLIAFPILTVHLFAQIYNAIRWPSLQNLWQIVVAFALVVTVFLARYYALRNQDRLIRLEESIRLARCLPDELRSRMSELSSDHLIALRFAPDDELPDLCRAIYAGEVRSRDEIKRRIRTWRPDYRRI